MTSTQEITTRRMCKSGRLWGIAAVLLAAGAAGGRVVGGEPGEPANGVPAARTGERAAGASSEDDGQDGLGRKWVRLLRDRKGQPLAMQTAVVRYARPAASGGNGEPPLTVDLIGAIHVGDKEYYQGLNKRFEQYDALLYELVAPEGTVVTKGRGTSSAHPVGAIQNGLKAILDLEHQLEHIDYTRDNFVHADMSPEQFAKSMDQRGESFLQMYFRLLGQELARQSEQKATGKSKEFEIFAALFSNDRNRRLKIALADQFEDMEQMLAGFSGPEGSTIITERNRVALDVLAKQLENGKRKVGVFYGAGHLADMDERLREDLRLQPVEIIWLDAWDLRP